MSETLVTIIKTAKRLFAKFGLRKTTVDDIAKEAHVGKGTIYHYFKSKEEVFIEVVKEEADLLRGEITTVVEAETSPEKKLRVYILTRMKLIGQFANFYSTFKQEYIEYYGFVTKIHEKYTNFEIETIKAFIKEGIEKGIFVVEDLDLTAHTIVVAMKGMEYYFALEPLPEMEKKMDIMLKVLFNGMMKR